MVNERAPSSFSGLPNQPVDMGRVAQQSVAPMGQGLRGSGIGPVRHFSRLIDLVSVCPQSPLRSPNDGRRPGHALPVEDSSWQTREGTNTNADRTHH